MSNAKIFNFLSIAGLQTLVGSSADKDVVYSADYDLMEEKDFKKTTDILSKILDLFRKKYKIALNPKSNIWIIDFKCGMFRGQPIRWDKASIKKGYVLIDNEPKYFVDCLQQESRIKMDAIALDANGEINEYSDIYFIKIGSHELTREISPEETAILIYKDFHHYLEEKNYFKAVKRLYSYAKIKNMKPLIKALLKVINSQLGRQSKLIADLNTINDLIENNFRKVPKSIILVNLSNLGLTIPKNNSLKAISEYITDLTTKNMELLNTAVVDVIKNNKLLNKYFNF
jgi:hypothetical protein